MSKEIGQKLLRRIGVGDPSNSGGVWFCGIREGDKHGRDTDGKVQDFSWLDQGPWTIGSHGDNNAGNRMAKVHTFIASFNSPAEIWREGTGTAWMNYFPLGAEGSKPYDKEYLAEFGFECQNDLEKQIVDIRYPLVQNALRERRPRAVICFGRTEWHNFAKLFDVERKECTACDGKVEKWISRIDHIPIYFAYHWSRGWLKKPHQEYLRKAVASR